MVFKFQLLHDHKSSDCVELKALTLTFFWQFVAARKPTGAAGTTGFIVWADMTKFGRMDNKQLNFATAIIHKVLSLNPTTAIAIVLAPHLTSEKVSGGHRGEIRHLDQFGWHVYYYFKVYWCPNI